MKLIKIRTKTEFINKPTELRNYNEFWIKRLIDNKPTHFQKHNQHGLYSEIFKINKIEIVDSPKIYLDMKILKTRKAIKIYGEME